jgi:hypothetical protein
MTGWFNESPNIGVRTIEIEAHWRDIRLQLIEDSRDPFQPLRL